MISTRNTLSIVAKIYVSCCLLFVLILAIFTVSRFFEYHKIAITISTKISQPSKNQYIDFLASNQQLLARHYLSSRIYADINLQNVDSNFLTDLILTEDEHFFKHRGVDFLATLAAIKRYIKVKYLGKVFKQYQQQKLFGGSTITQQLIKNLLGHKHRVIPIKIKEIILALMVEKQLSKLHNKSFYKMQILKKYLNEFFVSNNVFGLKNASYLFLKKNVAKLTVEDRIVLLAIINRPSVMNSNDNVIRDLLYLKIIKRLKVCKRIDENQIIDIKLSKGFGRRLHKLQIQQKPKSKRSDFPRLFFLQFKSEDTSTISTYIDMRYQHPLHNTLIKYLHKLNQGSSSCPFTAAFILFSLKNGAVIAVGEDDCDDFSELLQSNRNILTLINPLENAAQTDGNNSLTRPFILNSKRHANLKADEPTANILQLGKAYLAILAKKENSLPRWYQKQQHHSSKFIVSAKAKNSVRDFLIQAYQSLVKQKKIKKSKILKTIFLANGLVDSWFLGFNKDLLLLSWLGVRNGKALSQDNINADKLWQNYIKVLTKVTQAE